MTSERRTSAPLPAEPPSARVRIERMGARGDGVVATDPAEPRDGPRLVALALPGERVEAVPDGGGDRWRATAVLDASPERATPFCPVFGRCGGCAFQHWRPDAAAEWKRERVVEALRRAGLDAPVEPTRLAHGDGRRRATLHVRGRPGAPVAGFMAARRHDLVPIERCPVLEPGFADDAPRAAAALGGVALGSGKPLDALVTRLDGGRLDVDLRGSGRPSERVRAALVEAASRCPHLARLSVHGEALAQLHDPVLTVAGVALRPPPGAFLQATREGEAALAAFVAESLAALRRPRRIADLFCGVGPFAITAARAAAVDAFDLDRPAVAALAAAARGAPGLKPVTATARDLFRRPLVEAELDGFDAVILDPPRAGAEAQAGRLARSRVPLVVSLACDVASFARDAAILAAGGYRLERVVPIDQFAHAAHVEIAAVLRR